MNPILENEKVEENQGLVNLKSEYDRLGENKLKETAIKSRIAPHICKFELKNATNARNLPYTLNVNESFGEDNLSPNIEIDYISIHCLMRSFSFPVTDHWTDTPMRLILNHWQKNKFYLDQK